ncbi:MAG: branched-chain amino acid ABC transporter permease [Acidimicrobiia bacterium]
MALFLSQLMNGIGQGVVYASLALALVLIYKTTRILNFAQGEMALVSTYVTWWFTDLGLPVWLAILLSVVLSFIGGALIERVVMRPVERSSPLVIVIVTIGMFLALNSIAQVIWGVEALQVPRAYPNENWDIGGVIVRADTLVLVGVLALECLLLWVLLQKTKVGLALRAVASNPDSSRLVGVSVGAMLMFGWGLAAALGAVAGSLVVPTTTALTAASMQAILVFAFAAAALGGFDSPLGAVVGGLIVGVVNSLTIEYVDALDGIELIVPFGLILLVLLFRPAGLFGKVHVERV